MLAKINPILVNSISGSFHNHSISANSNPHNNPLAPIRQSSLQKEFLKEITPTDKKGIEDKFFKTNESSKDIIKEKQQEIEFRFLDIDDVTCLLKAPNVREVFYKGIKSFIFTLKNNQSSLEIVRLYYTFPFIFSNISYKNDSPLYDFASNYEAQIDVRDSIVDRKKKLYSILSSTLSSTNIGFKLIMSPDSAILYGIYDAQNLLKCSNYNFIPQLNSYFSNNSIATSSVIRDDKVPLLNSTQLQSTYFGSTVKPSITSPFASSFYLASSTVSTSSAFFNKSNFDLIESELTSIINKNFTKQDKTSSQQYNFTCENLLISDYKNDFKIKCQNKDDLKNLFKNLLNDFVKYGADRSFAQWLSEINFNKYGVHQDEDGVCIKEVAKSPTIDSKFCENLQKCFEFLKGDEIDKSKQNQNEVEQFMLDSTCIKTGDKVDNIELKYLSFLALLVPAVAMYLIKNRNKITNADQSADAQNQTGNNTIYSQRYGANIPDVNDQNQINGSGSRPKSYMWAVLCFALFDKKS